MVVYDIWYYIYSKPHRMKLKFSRPFSFLKYAIYTYTCLIALWTFSLKAKHYFKEGMRKLQYILSGSYFIYLVRFTGMPRKSFIFCLEKCFSIRVWEDPSHCESQQAVETFCQIFSLWKCFSKFIFQILGPSKGGLQVWFHILLRSPAVSERISFRILNNLKKFPRSGQNPATFQWGKIGSTEES